VGLEEFTTENRRRNSYSDEYILETLKQFVDEYDYLSSTNYNEDDKYPTREVVSQRFGSWEDALKEVGEEPEIDYTAHNGYHDEDKLELLARVMMEEVIEGDKDRFRTSDIDDHTDLPTASSYYMDYCSLSKSIFLAGRKSVEMEEDE